MKMDQSTYRLTDKGTIGRTSLILGVVFLAISGFGYTMDAGQFMHSYLTSVVFWTTIGLGGLFFTMLNHVVGVKWAVVLRRFSESVMVSLPLMIILFVPIAFGLGELYDWSDPATVAADPLLQKKSGYMNPGFFLARMVCYFAVWFILATLLYRTSIKQDAGFHPSQPERMRRISAPGIILFALTITLAAFDWLMSLDPHWYSTIFGVYVFVGSFVAALSFIILLAIYLRGKGIMAKEITVEHYHDLGKLLFAFVVFWTYIAFSQYFLIWYANIPEETLWFHERWEGTWRYVSLLIVFGHFVLPFLTLITRGAKRNLKVLKFIGAWILFVHWVDLHWIVMPNFHHHGVHLSWMDLTTMLGVGGIFFWIFWSKFSAQPITPVNDHKLEASFEFINS